MSKILKNTTGSIVVINDVGQQVPASGQLTIDPSDYDKYAQSSDVIVYIGNGTLVVNDGSFDLSISDGTDLIKGIFPQSLIVKGQVDDIGTVSGAEGDYTSVRITSRRGLHVNLRNQNGDEIGTAVSPVRIDPTGGTTQPVSAASLPLPTGAATAANQATEIASLASIDTKLNSQATAANQATEIASLQILDDVPAGMNAAFNKANPIAGQLDDTATTAASEDNVAPVRITPQRAFHANLRNQSGTEVGTAGAPVRTDPTGTTTQPISAAALPLPSGAATAANQATEIASLASIDSKLNSQATAANQATEIASLQVLDDVPAAMNAAFNKAHPIAGQLDDASTTVATEDNVAPVRITPQRAVHSNLRNTAGVEIGTASNPVRVDPTGTTVQAVSGSVDQSVDKYSDYFPNPMNYLSDPSGGTPAIDASQNLMIRGTVLSDEGTFRDDFAGSALTTALTGTLNFTNNSLLVTGSGTLFTSELGSTFFYIKKTADGEANYVQVDYVIDDTNLMLAEVYPGTTASSTGVKSFWKTNITGGSSITVGSGLVNLISSTASGNIARIRKNGDYLPYNLSFKANCSQRIANQTIIMGFQDNPLSPSQQAVFVLDGATNTTLKVRSSFGSGATEIQETTVTLASGLNTGQDLRYQLDLTANQVSFLINDIVVAIHKEHMPSPYTELELVFSIQNAAVVTTTTLAIDWVYLASLDQVQTTSDFTGEPQKVQLMGKSVVTGLPVDLALDSSGNLIVTALTGFNSDFSFGDITTAASTQVPVRRTAYTEQTTNAQRSIVSANANDTAAGTGARTVLLTYFTSALAGPFTETITLNGTTPVNTVATNICYIEDIKVITAGSGGANAGILTLRAAAGGGGAVIGTINAGDNQTFWAHHYVAAGKVCNITGVSASHNGTTVGSGGVFVIKGKDLSNAAAVESQVTDFIRLYGQSSTSTRTYPSPVKVNGPARIIIYVSPETTSSTVYRAAVDFFEP